MNNPTKEDVQEVLYYVTENKKDLEDKIQNFIHCHITEFYNKTGIPITNVIVDITESTDLKGDNMSYVGGVHCYHDSLGDF